MITIRSRSYQSFSPMSIKIVRLNRLLGRLALSSRVLGNELLAEDTVIQNDWKQAETKKPLVAEQPAQQHVEGIQSAP
jgi:hypothetical protein